MELGAAIIICCLSAQTTLQFLDASVSSAWGMLIKVMEYVFSQLHLLELSKCSFIITFIFHSYSPFTIEILKKKRSEKRRRRRWRRRRKKKKKKKKKKKFVVISIYSKNTITLNQTYNLK